MAPRKKARTTKRKSASSRKASSRKRKELRVGVVGIGRGMSFVRGASHAGMKLVALCDTWEERLAEVNRQYPDVETYADFDAFLEHDMDAVILANYCHQHAPFAVRAMEAGLHVMSEVIACKTLGEAAALVEAVEKTGRIYMFAENYPYMVCNQEMRRLYRDGEIGEARFLEGEYIHPFVGDSYARIAPGTNHWRNWIPATYYCTHSLGPLMYVTDAVVTQVNARVVPWAKGDRHYAPGRRTDMGSTILCTLDSGALAVVNRGNYPGHGNWYRVHGTEGLMENVRGSGGQLRVVHDMGLEKGQVRETVYTPEFPEHAEEARRAGHGGGDFFMDFHFATAIRTRTQPWLDVYRGVNMSMVGIQAWRSALADGAPMDIPDMSNASERKRRAADDWSPFPEDAGPDQPPPSINGFIEPSKANMTAARKIWRSVGWAGD